MMAAIDQLDLRHLRLICAGVLGLLAAVALSYVLLPSFKTYLGTERDRQLLQAAAAAGADVTEQIAQLQTAIADLQRELHGDAANLPDQQLESFVIGRLQSICWENDVELLSVKPSFVSDVVEEFSETLFSIELEGSYRNLYSWLVSVSEALGFVVIKEYQMRPVSGVADESSLRVSLTLAAYRVRES